MRLKTGICLAILLGGICGQFVRADDPPTTTTILRNHATAVAKADAIHRRAIEKAKDDAVSALMRLAAKAYREQNRLAETNAWKSVLKLAPSNDKAVQYFTDLGILDKVLAEVAGGDKPDAEKGSTTGFESAAFQEWVKKTAALPAEKQVAAVVSKLTELNPGFDGKVVPGIENDVVIGLTISSDKLIDISPVRALKGLTSLNCAGTQVAFPLADLSPLQGLALTSLNCGYTSVEDLSPLKGMKLTMLNCDFTAVSNLEPLQGMPLITINCNLTAVSDLGPLKGMPLVELNCTSSKVSDLTPLAGMPLLYLNCNSTMISDLSPLKGMKLQALSLMGAPFSDLGPLSGMPLNGLSFSGSQVTDLSPLKGSPVKVLYCQDTKVSLLPLKDLPLTHLWCDVKKRSELPILSAIKTLEKINDKPAAEFISTWSPK
jgi:Leucine-rich repeat (LRR) protein